MGAWVTHDLSAFLGDGDLYGGSNHEAWDGTRLARSGAGSFWRFALPDLMLSPTDVVDVEITFSPADPGHSTTLSAYNLNPLDTLGPSATFDDFHPVGGGFNAAGSNVTTADDTVYVSRFGPGVYAPGSDGEVFSSFQTSFDTYVATAARPYLMFRLSGASVGITQVRTRIVDRTDDSIPPDADPPPPYGGGGDVGPPDGGGPSGGVTGGGGPAAPTVGGGYQTTAVRRQSPTTAQVVIDGRWLTGLCPWGDLAWSHVWPGGSGNASWTAEKVPAALRKRGLTVKLMVGAECIWSGIQTEPDPTGATMNAAGLFTIGEDWAALDSSGAATTVPDDAVDAAIVRGMPWLRRDSISTSAVDIDISQGPVTIGQLLDAYALSQTKRWAVDPNGYVYVAADPTTPAWHVLPLDGGLIPADNFATRLLGRYYNGSTYATATVTDDPGNNGIREATVDLTGYGTLTLTKAENRLQSLLDLGLSRPSWASPIVCGYGDILSPGQVPVGLERPTAGDLARVHGHIDETQTRGGRQWTDVLLGQTDVADDTLTLTPMNMPARTLSDVMALAAQTKKGA